MAIATKNPSSLKMRFEFMDENYKTKTKSKTYGSVKPTASNDDIHTVGSILASLQELTLLEIARIDNTTLSA